MCGPLPATTNVLHAIEPLRTDALVTRIFTALRVTYTKFSVGQPSASYGTPFDPPNLLIAPITPNTPSHHLPRAFHSSSDSTASGAAGGGVGAVVVIGFPASPSDSSEAGGMGDQTSLEATGLWSEMSTA